MTAKGSVRNEGAAAESFQADYANFEKIRTAISFNEGALTEALNDLPPKKQTEHWVELRLEYLKSMVDQIAAVLGRTGSQSKVCGRTIWFFRLQDE